MFCSFLSPRWSFVLQTEILGKYNSSLQWSNSLTSKCIENWALFERKGYVQTSEQCCEQCCVRLRGAKGLTGFKLWATTRNNMQQRAQTDATCNIQQCWELLVNNVASVCTQPYAQPAIGVIGIPWGPQGCAQRKALESQLFLVQFKDAFISTFQRLDLH